MCEGFWATKYTTTTSVGFSIKGVSAVWWLVVCLSQQFNVPVLAYRICSLHQQKVMKIYSSIIGTEGPVTYDSQSHATHQSFLDRCNILL